MNRTGKIAEAMAALTPKQMAVLDLLVQHKTSKEIARLLDISPYTVDQRVTAARKKFGVETRNELAAAYMQAAQFSDNPEIYQELVYQSSQLESEEVVGDKDGGSDAVDDDEQDTAGSPNHIRPQLPVTYYRVVPETFEGRYGYIWRLAAIIGITLMFLFAILAGFAMFGQLSDMMR